MRNHRSLHPALRQKQRGMTLLEIMIVIAILGLLATVVVQNLVGNLENSKIRTTQLKISQIGQAANNYFATVGEYPTSLNDLANPPDGLQPFIKGVPKDPWGHAFEYKLKGGGTDPFEIISVGPDGQRGSKDDVRAKGSKSK